MFAYVVVDAPAAAVTKAEDELIGALRSRGFPVENVRGGAPC